MFGQRQPESAKPKMSDRTDMPSLPHVSPDDALADRAQDEHGKVDEASHDQDHPEQEDNERRTRGVERGPRAGMDPRPGDGHKLQKNADQA